ncbi:hypothetical protein FOQG_16030 [Fusarium oxysporum f. sp. raphani 54005]|uniref:LysM domain-containing protein n=2 Tax=Fusarium oxysporum f. sp. raphani TaxID=96318 RepID=X0C9G9_FUSOX|nr:hypothetical protein FOQG_16030 [Fusarium oxysporum f. sp. raphani 54005]KAG7425377.1 LysM domain-containing protein [Fusarium oxysporum f. sp. raphani]RKL12885.1 LysM domain-containing protein [Fusarium oxysporum]
MHLSTLFVHGILAVGVTASRGQRLRRQDGQVDPGQPSDCTWWETKEEDYQDCTYLEEGWNLKHSQFVEYNPSVKDDCSGMQFGHSYCVEVNNGIPRKGETTTTQAAEPEPTKDSKPSPTQAGLIDTCTSFYQAKKGDTCAKIISDYKTFDFDDFYKWNPAVDKDCSGIWANTWYCVGVPGTPTSPATRTAESTTKPTGPTKPTATQEGIIESCTAFHQAAKGETCAKIVASYGTFDFDTFFKWNPAVGKDCSGIWANYYYCVGIPGTPTVKPSAASPKPTATGGVETPSPIQEGIAKNCNKFHQVAKTTTCSSIESYYKLPFAQFLAWNPAVGKDCSGLWANYWVCISVEGYKSATTTTAKPTSTKPANGIETPSPIQNGMVKNCEKFHQIKSTTTCTSIENYYNLPLSTFLSWNPAVGKDCTALLTNYWVCVATVGWKPPTKTTAKPAAATTKSPNGISTPPPIQNGMVSNCNKFHMVTKSTTCDSIQNYYKISMEDFAKWNPAVGSKCTGLWANYNVCVGVIGGTPTKPSTGVKTPSPIQSGMVSNCKKFHPVASTTTCDSIQKYYKITMAQLVKWNPAIGAKCTGLWAKYYVCVGV